MHSKLLANPAVVVAAVATSSTAAVANQFPLPIAEMENSGFDMENNEVVCGDSDEEGVARLRSGEVVDLNEGQDESHVLELEKKLLEQVVYSEEEAYMLYRDYAQAMGFNVRRGKQYYFMGTKRVRSKTYCCSKEGVKDDKSDVNGVCYKKAETRTGCRAMISFACDDSGQWKVSRFEKEHNHEMAPPYAKPVMKSGQAILAANAYGSGNALESLEIQPGTTEHCHEINPILSSNSVIKSPVHVFYSPDQDLSLPVAHKLLKGKNEQDKIRELSLQLAITKSRADTFERQAAAYKRQLHTITDHVEEYNQSLSRKIQKVLINVAEMESKDGRNL